MSSMLVTIVHWPGHVGKLSPECRKYASGFPSPLCYETRYAFCWKIGREHDHDNPVWYKDDA